MKTKRTVLGIWAATALTLAAGQTAFAATAAEVTTASRASATATREMVTSYIVQAGSLAAAKAAVQAAGGSITHELGIINAVGAELTAAQARALAARRELTLSADRSAKVMGISDPGPTSQYVLQTGADQLHAMGITGRGITVAVLDTGTINRQFLNKDAAGNFRLKAQYDALTNTTRIPTSETPAMINDGNGHGTHIQSIISNRRMDANGKYNGMAPEVNIVSVKAFDTSGQGTYANVIRGLDWILANRTKYNIRVLNLSFGATAQSSYWNDPVNQATMKLWQAGVVVVASAGNWGPYAQSITVPGNTPYVITVGATTDNYTPTNKADDRLASFSSTGPTDEGFVKPEIVAPGGHITGIMAQTAQIPMKHPEFHFAFSGVKEFFAMSGTSQAAAVTSGAVALMLQAQPSLTPNQVKCKLMSSAQAAMDASGKLAYSVFQQGAGSINALAAVYNPYTNCGNVGLDIAADLAGAQHFGGPANQKDDGTFIITDPSGQEITQQGFLWQNGYTWNQGYVWSNGYFWSKGYLWNQGYLWSKAYFWKKGTAWNQSFVPAVSSYSGVNHWVDQE